MEPGQGAGVAVRRAGLSVRRPSTGMPVAPRTGTARYTDFLDPGRCPELDCIEGLLPSAMLAAARERAAAVGVTAEQVLITAGHLSEEAYLKALGESLGVAFEPLDGIARARCPIDDDALIEGATTGLLPLSDADDLALVVAPRARAVRRLIAMLRGNPALARRFRFTTGERLNRFVLRHAGKALATRATDHLRQTCPALSAGPRPTRTHSIPLALAGVMATAGVIVAPIVALHIMAITLAMLFLAWLGLRFSVAFTPAPSPPETAMSDDALPVYSVVAALYREAASVDGLLRAIERFNYPPEKLDVIVALETDDHETRAALAARYNRIPISIINVPEDGPRTKPKALNVALPFAHGSFTVIYDAEDRPEPNQLRRALQAFGSGGKKLACVQARLCIDNTADGWLASGIMAQTPQDL
jgi:hypothetical protein